MAVQSIGLAQVTLDTTRAFSGVGTADHVAPASPVVMTTPLPGSDAPLDPTAMHSVVVGQDTPLSWGVLPPGRAGAAPAAPRGGPAPRHLLCLPGAAAIGGGVDHGGAARGGGIGPDGT